MVRNLGTYVYYTYIYPYKVYSMSHEDLLNTI